MKTKYIDPESFVIAAEHLHAYPRKELWRPGCCWALDQSLRDGKPRFIAKQFLEHTLRPLDWERGSAWWYGTPVDGCPETDDMRREARLLGLLLCSELVRDGFVPPGFNAAELSAKWDAI